MAAGGMARDRYQMTPPSVAPHSVAINSRRSHALVLGFTNRVSHSHEFGCAGLGPEADVGLEAVHHGLETWQGERLGAVADGLLGARVDFDDDAIGADRDAGAREGRNQ